MKVSEPKENLPDEFSKSCRENNNEIKKDIHFLESLLDVDVKPFRKINIKVSLRSLLMITGYLFLAALCCILFEISVRKATTPNQNSNIRRNSSFTLDKMFSDKNESLSQKENLASNRSDLNQSTSTDRYESNPTVFSIYKPKGMAMSTKFPLPNDDTKLSAKEIPDDK